MIWQRGEKFSISEALRHQQMYKFALRDTSREVNKYHLKFICCIIKPTRAYFTFSIRQVKLAPLSIQLKTFPCWLERQIFAFGCRFNHTLRRCRLSIFDQSLQVKKDKEGTMRKREDEIRIFAWTNFNKSWTRWKIASNIYLRILLARSGSYRKDCDDFYVLRIEKRKTLFMKFFRHI